MTPRMQAHEIMRDVLRQTPAKQLAAQMELSLSLIYKWAEPPQNDSGSGASSPLNRVGQLIRFSEDPRIAQWVCEQSGGFFISNPKAGKTASQLIPITNAIVQEFADMLATIAKAAGDNIISPEEARDIRRRWEELKSVTEGFVRSAENGDFGKLLSSMDKK